MRKYLKSTEYIKTNKIIEKTELFFMHFFNFYCRLT